LRDMLPPDLPTSPTCLTSSAFYLLPRRLLTSLQLTTFHQASM
jgi:hypothetical protein